MIRILQLPGNLSKSNGRMTVLMNIYKKLDRSEVQFDFLATLTTEENYIEEIKLLGGAVFFITDSENSFKNVRQKMREVLSNKHYDVVHYHAISEWGAAIDIPKRKKIKVITHSHATKLSDSILKSIRNRLFSLNIFFCSDRFAACSIQAGKKLFLGKKFTYVPNVVNLSKYIFNNKKRKTYRKLLKIDDNTLVIGNTGRLAKQKNQKYMLRILKKLLQEGIDAKLIIVGGGPLSNDLYNESKNLGLINRTLLVGEVNNSNDYYSAMDVFLLPSLYEGLPMAGVEAQANGLPSIFSNTTSSQVNVFNAKFIETNNNGLQKWANQVVNFWKLGRDNCSNYHIRVSGFDANYGVSNWVKLYKETIL